MKKMLTAALVAILGMLYASANASVDAGELVQSVVMKKSYFTVHQERNSASGIAQVIETEHPYVTGHRVYAKDGACAKHIYAEEGSTIETANIVLHGKAEVIESKIPKISVTVVPVDCSPYL